MAWQAALGSIGSFLGGAGSIAGAFGIGSKGTSRKRELDSLRLQSQASREDIPLRVEAFRNAGIHPLFGMGAQPFQPSPSGAGYDAGVDLAALGQGVGRAASAFTSKEDRAKADLRDGLMLEKMKLENDLLKSQITSVHHSMRPPPVPGLVDLQPSELKTSMPGRKGVEAGVTPALKGHQAPGGGRFYGPNQELAEGLEGMGPAGWVAGADLLMRGILPAYAVDIHNAITDNWTTPMRARGYKFGRKIRKYLRGQ